MKTESLSNYFIATVFTSDNRCPKIPYFGLLKYTVTTIASKVLFTRYPINYVSDPFSSRTGLLFTRLNVNPIRSSPTIRYNSALSQQVVRKVIQYSPYWLVSCVNIHNLLRNASKACERYTNIHSYNFIFVNSNALDHIFGAKQ